MNDINVMMEFRQEHWDLWKEFVKDEDEYCPNCSEFSDYCRCIHYEILKYDTNDIHISCESLGFSTDWEEFEEELKTYTEEDKKDLLKDLKGEDILYKCVFCGKFTVNNKGECLHKCNKY